MEKKKVVVFGSFVTDLTTCCPKFPQEGETVKGDFFKTGPGGKGSNQAVAAHRTGADVTLITKLGIDTFGEQAEAFYQKEKMCMEGILKDKEISTGAALIMVNSETMQNEIVVIPGACGNITEEDLIRVLPIINPGDVVLTQLETNYDATLKVLQYSKAKGCTTILNPAPAVPLDDEILSCVDIITPNETEASVLTGKSASNELEDIRGMAKVLKAKGISHVIITRGSEGSYLLDDDEYICPSMQLGDVVDTTGAGDAYNGALAAGLSFGYDVREAMVFATVVSGLAVTKFGTAPAMPFAEEINKEFSIRR